MEHSFIDEQDLVSRYVAGQLPPEQVREFEAHFVDCAVCLQKLELEQDLRDGLMDVQGGVRVTPTAIHRRPRAFASIRTMAAAAAVLIAIGTSAAYFQARRQLDAAAARTATLERETAQALAAATASTAPTPASPPRVSVFELDSTRSAASADTSTSIAVAPATSLVVFSLAVGNTADYASFTATIETKAGATVLRQDGLEPASATSVGVAVDASKLSAGDYTIVLDGVIRNRPPFVIARYPLHVVRR